MTTLTSMCEMVCQIFQKNQEEKRIEEEQAAKARYWKIPACCDDDDDYNSLITPEETVNSLSMEDEHLDTIPTTESDEVIKSSVENLVLIPSESKGIPDTMCDVHLVNNPTLLEAKDHFEIVINSNNDISSSDDDSLYNDNIEFVEASPHDSELVSLEAAEIVIPEEEEIEDDNLREKLLNVHPLIANIEAIKDNHTPSSKLLTKSSSTSPKSFFEETNTFHNSLLEFENFYFDLEEISSGSSTTHSNISLPNYEAFYFDDDHIKEISSGSTITHSDISLSEYDSFTFDLSNDQCPPTDRSNFTHEEFADELAHIISPTEYDCFYFKDLPDPGELIFIFNSELHENLSFTTRVNLPIEDDHSPLLAYVVWIFLAYLMYPVIPPYLHSFGNEDTIFDPEQCHNQYFNFPQDFQDVPQQYPCCDDCGVTHDAYQCQPMNEVYNYGQNSCYDSTSIGFDQSQPPQSPVIHQPPQELSIQEMEDLKHHTHPSKRLISFCFDDDDDEDYTSAITPDKPVLSTEEPHNSLSMGDEHLDTIPAMESDQFIKSGVENLIPIPSESEGIPEHVCDVPSHANSLPLDVLKDTIEDFSESNEDFSSTDDDCFSFDKIDYVEASPLDSELVSSEVDAFLSIDDESTSSQFPKSNLDPEGDMLLFEAFLNDDHSSDSQTKSSYTSLNSLLEETHIFHNSLPEIIPMEIDPHSFNVESGLIESMPNNDSSIIIPSKIDSLFDEFAGELTLLKSVSPGIDETDCHLEEEILLTKRLLYDNSSPRPPEEIVSNNSNADIKSFSPSPIPIKDSDSHMEEIDLSLNLDEPNSRDFTKDVVEDISLTKGPQVLTVLPTHPTLQLNMKFQPSSDSLFAYVVWIFLPFLVYSAVPYYLLSLQNEDIIFDPGICKYHFSKPDISHRCRTVKKFNTHHSHLN
nr:hypothetical protein [Tanacetum cinerariifolium]